MKQQIVFDVERAIKPKVRIFQLLHNIFSVFNSPSHSPGWEWWVPRENKKKRLIASSWLTCPKFQLEYQ